MEAQGQLLADLRRRRTLAQDAPDLLQRTHDKNASDG
jgi:hypothetical protein